MIVYPSIDIQGGRVIRTSGADLESADELPGSPIEMARRWVAAGARWLHVVDVDGARTGTPRNLDDLRDIVALGIPVQAVGGIRDAGAADRFAETGAARIVVAAAMGRDTLRRLIARYGERLAAAVYVRDGTVVASPWDPPSDLAPELVLPRLHADGVHTVIHFNVSAAGSLSGPDLAGVGAAVAAFGGELIASGGVGTLADIRALARTGARGVVVGRALDRGKFTLPEAMREGLTARPATP